MPRIFYVTLSRSDYASMRPVARAALADPALDVKIIAGGSHMLARYGNTIEHFKIDGLPVHEAVEFLRESDDNPAELARAYARAVDGFVTLFAKEKPDTVFIIGDRWEMLAVATAASMLQIPIIHHSGGDITQGSADNQTRYALTCLSHLHLVALPEHRERLLAMGEEPWRVITTGEPALTELTRVAASVSDIHAQLGLQKNEPFVLATFHPTSFDPLPLDAQIEVFISALETIDDALIITAPNPDSGSDVFLRKLQTFAAKNPRAKLHSALGAQNYYAAMAQARYMIGNSSSGLWEAPSFALPVVNIGSRQQDRAHGANVINVPLSLPEIQAAIARASDSKFRATLSPHDNPYARADTIKLILDCFKKPHDRAKLLAKKFMDPLSAL